MIHDHLAKDLAPKYVADSGAQDNVASPNKKSPGPAAYGDISSNQI